MAPTPRGRRSAAEPLVAAARALARAVAHLKFAAPVAVVYNPLLYAWDGHEAYLRAFGAGPKRVVFLGMNPGPFGMVQTGIPFGEVTAVRNWLGIQAAVGKPPIEHPRRPVLGFACPRSEVSGRRLWGLFATRFGTAGAFFREHLVLNYCPVAFLEATGRNQTPDKLPPAEREGLFQVCDEHLRQVVAALRPEWLIGVGDFAFKRAEAVFGAGGPRVGRILHPSPASPAANRDWPTAALKQLQRLGVWE
jgi:single-strand selective monofunctional uracil DNA glycosylase